MVKEINKMEKRWLKIKDIPEYCGISERLARDWMKSGLRYCRVGGAILIKKEDLDKFIDDHEVK